MNLALNIAGQRKSKLSPEENRRRYNLWKQGYTDCQIAKELGIHPTSVMRWREERGLPPNKTPANPRNFRWGTGEWNFKPGERLRVGIKHGVGASKQIKWHTGVVLEVYRRFVVIKLPQYRITATQWDVKDGSIKIERLTKKTG